MIPQIREKLERLPRAPGVYVMRGAGSRVLYVGKAADLRSRVRSYFAPGTTDSRFFVGRLEEELQDLETIVTANEREAFLLENSLIKELRPRYNIRLRDDKDYLSIRIDEQADWPRLELVRRPHADGARYHGPFSSAQTARQAVRVIQRLFRLRPCRDSVFRGRTRPCLVYQLGRCDGPCVLPVDRTAYHANVHRAQALLEGRRDAVLEELHREMKTASGALDFERAAEQRDLVAAVERAAWGEPQDVIEVSKVDRDVVGLHRDGPVAVVVVLEVRSGRLLAVRSNAFSGVDVPDDELLAGFLGQRYAEGAAPPDDLLLPIAVPEESMLASFLGETRGRRVRVLVPQRGRLRRLVEMAQTNAAQRFREESRDRESAEAQAQAVAKALGLRGAPRTIECVDISHWGGHTETGTTVGAITAVRDGKFDKQRYRLFRLRGEHAGDDYAAMREVLLRRFERARAGDARWAPPDLLVVDGGRGQLAVAAAVFHDLGVQGTALAAIAKPTEAPVPAASVSAAPPPRAAEPTADRQPPTADAPRSVDHLYVACRKNPVKLRPGSPALHLIARLRDETHRFAVTFQGRVRGKRRLTDRLSHVPGIGPVTRRRLLAAFGSVARLAQATIEQLLAVEGVTELQAQAVLAHLARDPPGES